ncbi:hypothetical protein F5B21DRAFT_475774 [Xylaria acuta]|nr:hypothetical protein F5B21DRAFT_475774 [Xylaria acuta]
MGAYGRDPGINRRYCLLYCFQAFQIQEKGDEGAHEVHPAFWTFETHRVPRIRIKAGRVTSKTWMKCSSTLYKEVLQKYGMTDAIIAFPDGNRDTIHGPACIWMNGTLIARNGDLDGFTLELMSAKVQMLQYQSPYARTEEEKQWYEHALKWISGLRGIRGQEAGRAE